MVGEFLFVTTLSSRFVFGSHCHCYWHCSCQQNCCLPCEFVGSTNVSRIKFYSDYSGFNSGGSLSHYWCSNFESNWEDAIGSGAPSIFVMTPNSVSSKSHRY